MCLVRPVKKLCTHVKCQVQQCIDTGKARRLDCPSNATNLEQCVLQATGTLELPEMALQNVSEHSASTAVVYSKAVCRGLAHGTPAACEAGTSVAK